MRALTRVFIYPYPGQFGKGCSQELSPYECWTLKGLFYYDRLVVPRSIMHMQEKITSMQMDSYTSQLIHGTEDRLNPVSLVFY